MNAITKRASHQRPLVVTGSREAPPIPFASQLFGALGECVYAIVTPDDLVKIGFCSHPKVRLAQLGGYRNLLALWVGDTYEDEQAIHASLNGHAVKGREWYSREDPAVIKLVNDWRTGVGLTPFESLPYWH